VLHGSEQLAPLQPGVAFAMVGQAEHDVRPHDVTLVLDTHAPEQTCVLLPLAQFCAMQVAPEQIVVPTFAVGQSAQVVPHRR
jgi:hypothetical protein